MVAPLGMVKVAVMLALACAAGQARADGADDAAPKTRLVEVATTDDGATVYLDFPFVMVGKTRIATVHFSDKSTDDITVYDCSTGLHLTLGAPKVAACPSGSVCEIVERFVCDFTKNVKRAAAKQRQMAERAKAIDLSKVKWDVEPAKPFDPDAYLAAKGIKVPAHGAP